ncbi:MAG: class I SAM-dependent methyltransferase [Chloroflexi bacterium]|nr:class I SAM-dependent methyltransferase [Chloroflexota bacterium]
MPSHDHGPSDESSTTEFSYFGMQSSWGATKHFGGLPATDLLATECQIGKDKTILEVGCGVGVTTCHLAKRYGCRVVGVDLSEQMVAWAQKRVVRRGLAGRIELKVADAQDLPFEDGRFDAVICESVAAFPPDKARVIGEFSRVAKPGGSVGLNEGTWINGTPPEGLLAYIQRTMAGAIFLTPDGWCQLLESCGLQEVTAKSFRMNAIRQRINEMAGLDMQDQLDRLRAWGSFLGLSVKSAAFRRYAREIMPSPKIIASLFHYLGYGIYVGKKPLE